jgi:serine protein kinase
MFTNTEELLPVISFNAKSSGEDKKKHEEFISRMVEKGYTAKQVRLLCEWYLRVRKSQ